MNRGNSIQIEDKLIDSAEVQKIMKDLKEKPDLVQITFENNEIVDDEGLCQVFQLLKNYEKLEGINFRSNNFNEKLIEALADGIKMKKELRVSINDGRSNNIFDIDSRPR